jgi:hypothetical protein
MTSFYLGITERENEPYLRLNMRKPPVGIQGAFAFTSEDIQQK